MNPACSFLTRLTQKALILILSAALTGSLTGHLSAYALVGELCSQFQLHALLASLLAAPLLYVLSRKRSLSQNRGAVFLVLATLMSAALAVAPALTLARPALPSHPPLARVLFYNVMAVNRNQPAVVQLIEQEQPDIAVLLEGNARWQASTERLRGAYPHQYLLDDAGNFGIILLSRWRLSNISPLKDIDESGITRLSLLQADVELPGGALHVIAAHPIPPLSAKLRTLRDQAMALISQQVQGQRGPVLLVGDFNATIWTDAFQTLMHESELNGATMRPSWPAPLGSFGIGLDQILGTHGLIIGPVRTGPAQGSDHLARIADVYVQ